LTATPLDRFAVLSDIHGNLSALEAVLADIASRSVSQIVNLGDHLQGPLDPVGHHRRSRQHARRESLSRNHRPDWAACLRTGRA
jgi:hypothetical protein